MSTRTGSGGCARTRRSSAPTGGAGSPSGGGPLPVPLRAGFSTAMGQSLLLPAAVLVVGWVAVLCFARPRHQMAPTGGADPRTDTSAATATASATAASGSTVPTPETVASR